jgi:hypothetical protein
VIELRPKINTKWKEESDGEMVTGRESGKMIDSLFLVFEEDYKLANCEAVNGGGFESYKANCCC